MGLVIGFGGSGYHGNIPDTPDPPIAGPVKLEINLEFAGAFDEGWNDARYGTAVLNNTVTGDGLVCNGQRVTYDNYTGNYDGSLRINLTLLLNINDIPEGYAVQEIWVNWSNNINGIGVTSEVPYYFNIADLLAEKGVGIDSNEHYQIDIYIYMKAVGERNTDNMTHVFMATIDPSFNIIDGEGQIPVSADYLLDGEQIHNEFNAWDAIDFENRYYNSPESSLNIGWDDSTESPYTRQAWAVYAFYDDADANGERGDETYWQTLLNAAIARGDLIGATWFDSGADYLGFSNEEDLMNWLIDGEYWMSTGQYDLFNHDQPRVDVDTVDYSRHINIVIGCVAARN